MVFNRILTKQELQTLPHIILSSQHEWDPHNIHFPKATLTAEEDILRAVGYIRTQEEDFILVGILSIIHRINICMILSPYHIGWLPA